MEGKQMNMQNYGLKKLEIPVESDRLCRNGVPVTSQKLGGVGPRTVQDILNAKVKSITQ